MGTDPARPPLQAVATHSDDECTLQLTGEFDLSTVALFQRELAKALRTDAASVVIDLSRLEFIDSSGLAALIQADAQSRADSDRVAFSGPLKPQVAKIMRVTELDDRLELG